MRWPVSRVLSEGPAAGGDSMQIEHSHEDPAGCDQRGRAGGPDMTQVDACRRFVALKYRVDPSTEEHHLLTYRSLQRSKAKG